MTLEELPERDMFGARPGEMIMPSISFAAQCSSCKAAIVWVRPGGGKAIPLSLASSENRDGVVYALPHWLDCPKAEDWT